MDQPQQEGKQRRTSQKPRGRRNSYATPSHIIGGKGRSTRGTVDLVVLVVFILPSLSFAFTILVLPPLPTGALRGATPADNHAPKGKLVICKHSRPLALNQLFTVFDAAYSEEEGISLSR